MDIIAPNELKVNAQTETVSARSIHDSLEISKRFSEWFSQFKDDFTDGTDYSGAYLKVQSNQYGGEKEIEDYQISIEMAKHICMMSHSDKGKQMRQYFIDLEKAWNTPDLVIARGLLAANTLIAEKDKKIELLTADNERMKPKEIFTNAVTASDSSILVRDLAKMIRQNGYPIGEKRLYKWMRENGYICQGSTEPTQRAMEMGVFERIVRTVLRGDKLPLETTTTKVTGKGQVYFINKIIGESDADET